MILFQPSMISRTELLNSSAFRDDTSYIVFNKENSGIYVKTPTETIRFGGFDIYDNLISFSKDNPLSANMGRVLNEIKINYTNIVDSLDGVTKANKENVPPTITEVLSANMGKVLDNKIMELDEKSIKYTDLIKDFTDPNITSINKPLSSYLGYILFTTINNYMESNNSRVEELEHRDNINKQELENEIDGLRTSINTNANNININKNDIARIKNSINDINSYQRDQDVEIEALQNSVRINRDNININKNDILNIKTSIGNIRVDLGNDRRDIETLLLTVATLDGRLTELESYIDKINNGVKYSDIITSLEELRTYDINNLERDNKVISAGVAYELDQRTRVMRVSMLKHNAPARIFATMLNGPNEIVQDGNCHVTVYSWEGQAIKTNQIVHMLEDTSEQAKPENRRSGKFVTMLA